MKIIVTFLIITVLFLGCGKKIKNEEEYYGIWTSTPKLFPYKAILTIKPDHTYFFDFGACKKRGFSKGHWQLSNDTIFLNSFQMDSCYFISEFGVICYNINDTAHLGKKTRLNCEPIMHKDYVIFAQDKFYIRNDSLFHVAEVNSACPDMKGIEDIFYREKKKN